MSSPPTGGDEPADGAAAALLHSIGYLCLAAGNSRRALAFLLIANCIAPDERAILYALANAFIANGTPMAAIGALERLERIEGGRSPGGELMRARALWAADDRAGARAAMRRYLAARKIS